MLENRTKFCEKVGFDPSKPFLVYLGSSSNIARDETWLVRELYSCIKRHPNPRVRDLNLLVRPHPANARSYEKLKGLSIVVWPEYGALPETEETQKDFYNSLHHCMLALGINTSGMIDAIINNRPCLTIMAKRYCETQQKTSHFKQLLKANVLEVAQSLNEAMEAIIRIMEGNDRHREQRRQFIRDFIRPCGLDRDAGKVAARAIELTAQGESALKIKAKICI